MSSSRTQTGTVLASSGTRTASPAGVLARLRRWALGWMQIPAEVGTRVGLLLGALCVIKILLLVTFRKHLFEIHWRVSREPFDWTNLAIFYSFALLVGLNLWVFAKRCASLGKTAVRSANACVLVLGASFVLLTFHEGQHNYLDPVLNGLLQWKDLGAYLKLNFFFRPPFAAAWLAGYGLIYYVLARTGKEQVMLRVTAVFAGAYIALCLPSLASFRCDLIIADCLGVVSLLWIVSGRRPVGLAWLALPLVWTAGIFVLFHGFDIQLSFAFLDREFAILAITTALLFGIATALAWKHGYFADWSGILPFAFGSFALLINTNYRAARAYDNLLCVGMTLPNYFLSEFGLAFLMLLLAMGYRRWRPHGSLRWFDVMSLALIALSLADLKLSLVMGTRLEWHALALGFGETPRMMWRMAKPYLPVLAAVLVGAVVAYAICLRFSGPALDRLRRAAAVRHPRFFSGGSYVLMLFLLLGCAGAWVMDNDKAKGQTAVLLAETSPLWQRATGKVMNEEAFAAASRQLGIWPSQPARVHAAESRRDLNVVLIFQESTYNKHLSLFGSKDNTQPLLSAYKDRMELFPDFFSNFTGSMNARFATFAGLYPVQDYSAFTLERVPVKSLFEVLHDNGYTCSMFYSSYFDYTGFRDFLRGRELDEMYDADNMPGQRKLEQVSWGLREEETLGAIQSSIRSYATNHQRFFLTYVPAAPHNPFDGTPERFRKYKKEKMGDFTPPYLNELLYMDWILTSIVDQLRDSGLLDRTLVVITGDHGEMLGNEGGPVGHGWAVTPELQNVPLIIMDPGRPGYRINDRVGSQVDLLPTILNRLGIAAPTGQLYQGMSLDSADPASDRKIYVNSFYQYAIVEGRHLTCGDRDTDRGASESQSKHFEMTNDGAHTEFAEIQTQTGEEKTPPIARFDEYQANFLRNYDRYCKYSTRSSAGEQHRRSQESELVTRPEPHP